MKAYLLFLYAISLYITLNAWYKEGNSGIPDPTVIGPATYVFALLLLTSNFLQGLPAILGSATTFILFNRAHGTNPSKPHVPKKGSATHHPAHKSPKLKLGAKP